MGDTKKLLEEFGNAISRAENDEDIENIRIKALGKKGIISELLKSLGTMNDFERKIKGPQYNGLKNSVNELINQKRYFLKQKALNEKLLNESIDISLPIRLSPTDEGRIHPISQVTEEITCIFAQLGFTLAEGPDIETDYYNFTALNFPEGHPAREMHDTFFLKDKENDVPKLLRTHTSPVQIHTMERQKPPIRIIIPGKTYRMDSDATHAPMFHQVEGLVVDKTSTIANMIWVFEQFLKTFFDVPSINMRLRPSYFPFTEPSLEVDIQCQRLGDEIKFGQGDDWLEILGCGMVHPNVLKNVNLDPDIYQGFAWGMGIDRLAMLKYGMPDLRAFFDADIRWLKHYGFRPFDIPDLISGLNL